MSQQLDQIRHFEPPPPSDRSFGLWFALLCALAGLWRMQVRPLWLAAAVAFLLASLVKPAMLSPLNRAWNRFGLLLARVVNPLVMAAVWLIAIVPLGLIWKLLGHDPMRLRPQADSYWIPRTSKPESMLRQF